MKKKVVIMGDEWENSIYNTKEWNDSVIVTRYEHDYEKNIYIIDYIENGDKH